MGLAEYSIRHRATSWMFLLLLAIGGAFSFLSLPQLEDPEFTIKTAIIVTRYPGATPLEVEEEVTLPIEKAVQELSALDYVTSISSAGLSQVTVEIRSTYRGAQLQQTWDELRRKMADLQGSLPDGTSTPLVKDDFGDVYGILLALTAPGYSDQDLRHYVDQLQRELILVDGVGKVQIAGAPQEQISIEIPRNRLATLGLDPQRVASLIASQTSVNQSGHIRIGPEYLRIQPTGNYSDLKDLENLLLSPAGASQLIYLSDVAEIRRQVAPVPDNPKLFNGERAITLGISFASNVNVVDVGQRIRSRLAELEYTRPHGMELHTVYDQPLQVERSVNDFLTSLLQAIAIVIAVLLLFMGVRAGLLMGIILLLTILGTFIVMKMMDIALQRISLGALIIALGMLVDNAIVITEGVLVGRQLGLSTREAANRIVGQTLWALLGATVIGITAFAPIGLSADQTGEFAGSLFWVLLISLLLSWVTAITLTPFLCSLMFKEGNGPGPASTEDPYRGAFYLAYRRLLRHCMHHRAITLLAMAAALGASVWGFTLVKQTFFPPSTTPMILVDYWLPEGSDIRTTRADAGSLSSDIRALDGVKAVTATVGQGAQRMMLTYKQERHYDAYAQLIVELTTVEEREQAIAQIWNLLQQQYPQAFFRINRLMIGPSPDAKIEARFSGPDPKELRRLAAEAIALMRQDPATEGIRHDWRDPVKVLTPAFNEVNARHAGISKPELDSALALNTDGVTLGVFRDGSKRLPIVMRPPQQERDDPQGLSDIQIYSPVYGSRIPITQIIDGFTLTWQDPLIMRRDRFRTLTVQADPKVLGDEEASKVFSRLRPQIEAIPLPPGYRLEWGGEYESARDAQLAVFSSLPLGYLVMFIITLLLFNTWRDPLVIWCGLPLAMIGVTLGLLVMDAPFTFMALLGYLSLTGMLLKNGIVLMEQIKLEERQQSERLNAIIDAAVSRVRPVSMAAVTTILGMIPLLFDEFFLSMAVVIMFGLGFATILTLIVMPVIYTLFYRIPTHHARIAVGDDEQND